MLPKNNKKCDRIGGQTRTLQLLESSKYLRNEWEYVVGYIKNFLFEMCSQRKNYHKSKNSEQLTFSAKIGLP